MRASASSSAAASSVDGVDFEAFAGTMVEEEVRRKCDIAFLESDGDAVLHAIVDAILQAARLGDLGTHFGSARPEFAGANSQVFLDHTLGLLKDQGLQISSVAVQVVAQAPKVGPRREEAERTLSALV